MAASDTGSNKRTNEASNKRPNTTTDRSANSCANTRSVRGADWITDESLRLLWKDGHAGLRYYGYPFRHCGRSYLPTGRLRYDRTCRHEEPAVSLGPCTNRDDIRTTRDNIRNITGVHPGRPDGEPTRDRSAAGMRELVGSEQNPDS